jgi:hypothetical protein
MEFSPLRFLDNDVSQMLCEQVRLSREEEARRFHDDLYYNGEKMNKVSHELIVRIYRTRLTKFMTTHSDYHFGYLVHVFNMTAVKYSCDSDEARDMCVLQHARRQGRARIWGWDTYAYGSVGYATEMDKMMG